MSPIKKNRLQVIAIFILAVLAFLFTLPKGPNWIRDEIKLHLGLDLAGGAHLVYQADVSEIPQDARESAVEGTRDVIEYRVNALGVGEPVVQTNQSETGYRIIVELPGVADINQAINRIGDTPVLEFKEQAQPTPLTEVEKAEAIAYNESQKKKAQEILDELTKESQETFQLTQGIDLFARRASEFSEDPGSKDNGGNLEYYPQGTLVPEFENVLFDELKDNELYTKIVETEFGYHIIQRWGMYCKDLETNQIYNDCDTAPKNTVVHVRARHILRIKKSTEFKNPETPWQNTELSGEHLKKALAVFDPQTNLPVVSLEFNTDGSHLFEQITDRNVNKQVGIFLDGELLSAPRVSQKISGGNAVITGDFTLSAAQDLAKRLNAGALPVHITLISQTQIGASLGHDSVQRSFLAGVLGMALVIIFMIGYYRVPGIVATFALIIYTFIIISIFKIIPVVLTLSGIAGFILSIGLAVDANVLIFERIKEELRNGKTLQAAIDEGFARAWSSIRDSNISTLITAFILMWLGESLIKGFGITLGLGVLVSMFTAISVTRLFLKIIARQGKEGGWMWGL